jgi:ubiquinone/menaquinone biosynthesis C-methylase UbiE
MPSRQRSVNWSDYSQVYDEMASLNPPYQEMLGILASTIDGWSLDSDSTVVDLGAGTGNMSTLMGHALPNCRVLHVDSDSAMNAHASSKIRARALGNVFMIESDAERFELPAASVMATICIHSLYTLPNPLAVIDKIFQWTAPGGRVFACDLGRHLDVRDWRRFLFGSFRARFGLLGALRLLFRGRGVVRQNAGIAAMQRRGRYWLHSSDEFRAAFERCGFVVERSETCFRGYSDLLVCTKPAVAAERPLRGDLRAATA